MSRTPPRARLPATIWLLGLTSFFTDVGSELIFPLLPGFLAGLGGFALVGVVEGLADATAAIVKIPAGALSDRLPRRRPLVMVGYGLSGLVRPVMALATAPWHAIAVRVTDRIGKGIRSAPRDAMLADAAPPGQVGRAFGLHRAMDHAGAVVGPLIAAALVAASFEVTEIFLFAAIPGVFAFGALFLIKETARTKPQEPSEPTTGSGSTTSTATRTALPPELRGFLGVMVVFALGASSDAFLLVRASEVGTGTALLPVLWALLHVVKMVASWGFGIVADRVPETRLIALGFLVFAVTHAGLGLVDDPALVWALVLVHGTYYGLAEPAEKALVRSLAPASERGRAFGWYHGGVGLAAIPAGLLTGLLWETSGATAALLTSAAVALAALVLLLLWSARNRRAAATRTTP